MQTSYSVDFQVTEVFILSLHCEVEKSMNIFANMIPCDDAFVARDITRPIHMYKV